MRTNPVAAIHFQPRAQLWAITTRRLLPVDQGRIPLAGLAQETFRLVKLEKGEQLVTLSYTTGQMRDYFSVPPS